MNSIDSSNYIVGAKSLPGSKAYLTSQWVKDKLTFDPNFGNIPFRFVWLDGCNTANGNWPQAWGVPKEVKTLDYYQSTNNTTHARPSAFVGWNTTVGGSKEWGTINKFWQFRSFWMANWSVQSGNSQDNLDDVIEQARVGSGWVSTGQLWDHLQIYGYKTMKFKEFNRAGDWP